MEAAISDEALVAKAQNGDEAVCERLLVKYKATVGEIAHAYFLTGADAEDVVQEGMIGLYKAICSFKPQYDGSFAAFARLCVRRQILTAVRTATRKKNAPLNDYVSLQEGTEDLERLAMVGEGGGNPEDTVIAGESERLMRERVARLLSPLEQQILTLFLAGKTYREISAILGKDTKSVDNALARVRRKLACLNVSTMNEGSG